MKYFVGMDVGTTSVRGGLFDEHGKLKFHSENQITMWNTVPSFYEQSSNEIWDKVISILTEFRKRLGDEDEISGIAFDATCSLVVLDKKSGSPKSISLSGDENRNIIMWMDHRAGEETDHINEINHNILKYVGGKVFVEMEPPKLLWLKKTFGETYMKENYFFDLADFLTFKATGNSTRSVNTVTCKWIFDGQSGFWDTSFWRSIGMEVFAEQNYEGIGQKFVPPGTAIEPGLSLEASQSTGIPVGCPIAASIIDAYAGALSSCFCNGDVDCAFSGRMALIGGTSACHITITETPVFSRGTWGPYNSAIFPNFWAMEGGQSAAAKLLDHIVSLFSCSKSVSAIQEILEEIKNEKQLGDISFLTEDIHILPDFHGNRSPLNDPDFRGMISGLQLEQSDRSSSVIYLATVQALAYGTRNIIESLISNGHPEIQCVYLSGGLRHNPMYVQTHADVLGRPIMIPDTEHGMILGAAILAKKAATSNGSLWDIAADMAGYGKVLRPNKKLARYHEKKYKAFQQLITCQQNCKEIMLS